MENEYGMEACKRAILDKVEYGFSLNQQLLEYTKRLRNKELGFNSTMVDAVIELLEEEK